MQEGPAARSKLPVSPRIRSWSIALAVLLPVVGAAQPAAAALARFSLRLSTFFSPNSSPAPAPAAGEAVVEDGIPGGNSKLLHLTSVYDGTSTSCCDIGAVTFISQNRREGPAPSQLGTGSLATQIAWGVVTGWTVTGSVFCQSNTPIVCTAVGLMNLATVDSVLYSPFYDLGTWTFHATGFTAGPFIHQNFSHGGNNAWIFRGRRDERFLPLLPSGWLILSAGALLAAGAAWARRV